ncbi:MAG: tetratricopeptide repeat protein [Candidatus Eisenbacteria bacterium]|nr:tetratricopeptide repeat protein [Candidatus Eisenbacteria bacterium]
MGDGKLATVAGVVLAAVLVVSVVPHGARAQDAPGGAEQVAASIERLAAEAAARPDDVSLRIELGNLYYETGLLDKAVEEYRSAVGLDSLHVGARLNLASVYVDQGSAAQALLELQKARSIDPANPMVYTNLGSTYYWLQRYTEAVEMYLEALALDPGCVEAHFNLGVAFADAQIFDEAIREWGKVVELAPGSPVARTSADNIRMIEEFRAGGR